DAASRENARAGSKLAFGEYVDAQYRFDEADVILSLDADFLGCGPGSLRHSKDFSARRRPEQPNRMNRLYAIESMPSSTGARADHRLLARPSAIAGLAERVAAPDRSGGPGGSTGTGGAETTERFVAAVAKDLRAHRGRSLVVAGDSQPPSVHALAHAMN